MSQAQVMMMMRVKKQCNFKWWTTSVSAYTWKLKLFSINIQTFLVPSFCFNIFSWELALWLVHSQVSVLWSVLFESRWLSESVKYSLLSLHMKTKVVQHVPRINISFWHMTFEMWYVTCKMWHAKCGMWHYYKHSHLSLHMKKKLLSMSHRST